MLVVGVSVLAVAARFAQLPNVSAKERHMAGRAYANQSILALKADQSTPSSQSQLTLKTLQILVNLCIHASGGGMDHLYKPAAQHAILLHTECTRLAMMLNLHLIDEQPPMNLGARPDDKTITNLLAEKRRAWWCCFMLNQLSAMVNGQPVSIDEFTFQVDYPFETPNLLGNVDMSTGQVYIPQLLVLLGRVIQFANRPRRSPTSSDQSAITEREQQVAAQLEQELHGWYTQQLPVSLQNFPDIALAVDPTERDCQLAAISTHIALLCLYHTGIILLHRSLLIPHPTRDYCYRMKTPLEHQSIKTYRLSALSLLQLTGRITGDALLYQHPILAYSLWTAAIIWVHDHHILPASSTAALWEASTHLQMVCTLLNQLSVVWEYAGHLEEILKLMLLSPSTHGSLLGHEHSNIIRFKYT
ncbi:hypothetical protein BDF22DRAFT_658360 [Syncephalis plumigaleata]|nr:hypothetical protein BDF22DRAFT_658360 [Syncephalis plumigaleata]